MSLAQPTPALATGAAEYLGCCTWAMGETIWKGPIPIVRLPRGCKVWVDGEDLDRVVESNTYMID